MKVTTFSQILSDLGGTLGLWLGLGVLQLFQSVVIFKQSEAVKAFKKLMLKNDKLYIPEGPRLIYLKI